VSLTSGDRGRKETGRVEAFSDGVFAIVMTLLWHKGCAGGGARVTNKPRSRESAART